VRESDSRFNWFKDVRAITLAGTCAFIGFLISALIFGGPWHLSPDWGDIPTWMATIAATMAGIIAYRVYRIEAERDRISEKERRGAQASKIAAWYGARPQNVTQRMGGETQTYSVGLVWGAFLRNTSDLPVSDVIVRFHFPATGEHDPVDSWNVHTIVKQVLPPNDNPIHLSIDDIALRLYSDDTRMDEFHRTEMEFTDTQGVRWRRDVKGRLEDITEKSAGAEHSPLTNGEPPTQGLNF
jgi:hypothetical protein